VFPENPALGARVREANTARHVYELWDGSDVLPACADALCEQVARVLERFAQVECGGSLRARVALVDFTGTVMVGSSAEWAEGGDARHG
jgi:hypothetical protein